jgi:hypothetical protein
MATGSDEALSQAALDDQCQTGEAVPQEVLDELAALSTLPNADLVVLAGRVEDWDYTAADHTVMVGKLQYPPGTEWVPSTMRAALLSAVETILGTEGATTGVSPKDFYHGHVVVPRAANRISDNEDALSPILPQPLQSLMDDYVNARSASYSQAIGTEWLLTADKIASLAGAVEATLSTAKALLQRATAWPDATLIYHTFEHNRPSEMLEGDSRRNWKMSLAGGSAEMFTPPDVTNASSYTQDFKRVFQFCFLIDCSGFVHVRPFTPPTARTLLELSTITGVVYAV